MKQNIVLFALALSIAMAGMSPACKFISGKSNLIEICTAFGAKNISLPINGTKNTPQSGHQLTDQCAFCFATQTQKAVFLTDDHLDVPNIFSTQVHSGNRRAYLQYKYSHYHSTGPPRQI